MPPIVLGLVLLGVILLIPTAYAGKIGAPYAPTRIAVVKKAFDLIRLDEEDILVDLGAGDGKILLEAAQRGARATGYELSPIMWAVAFVRTRRHKKINLYYRNFYKESFPQATVVFAFLMPNNMARVRALLQRQQFNTCKYVLAYAFPFTDVVPLHIVQAPKCAPLYVYHAQAITEASVEAGQSPQNNPS